MSTRPRFWLRAVLALVLLLAVAAAFGARLAGYAAIFPLVAAVVSVFSHALHGPDTAVRFLAGSARGLWSVWAFALANVLCALSMSLSSGADSAYLYDHLVQQRQSSTYARWEGWSTAAKGMGNLAAVLASFSALESAAGQSKR
mgnify:CR=1 FL=1